MSDNIFKRTKILATIGPATFSQEKVYQLLEAGVNGIRMNFSHGANEERIEQINWVRTASKQLGKPVAILQDLQGPKIRLGVLKDNMLNVKVGDMLVLDSEITDHDGSFNLPVQYNLAEKMKVGEPLYMFDGKIRTVVREIVSQPNCNSRRSSERRFFDESQGLEFARHRFWWRHSYSERY